MNMDLFSNGVGTRVLVMVWAVSAETTSLPFNIMYVDMGTGQLLNERPRTLSVRPYFEADLSRGRARESCHQFSRLHDLGSQNKCQEDSRSTRHRDALPRSKRLDRWVT